ncbi:MAG: hypothetical protein WBD51_12295 [Burkholderiaceae bacterium]
MNKKGVIGRPVLRTTAAIAALAILSGCATHGGDLASTIDDPTSAAHTCQQWFGQLDQAALETGIRDAEARLVPGFSHLRVSRLLASFEPDLVLPSQQNAWLYRMRDLDQQARQAELLNMGEVAANRYLSLKEPANLGVLISRTQSCGERLVEYDRQHPQRLQAIRERAKVPDSYSTTRRVTGLYPLVEPMLSRVDRRAGDALRQHLADPPKHQSVVADYWPELIRRGQPIASRLVSSRRRDALGLPVLTEEVKEWLLQEYAPVIQLRREVQATRYGRLVLQGDKSHPAILINNLEPTVYGRVAMTRYQATSLIQLVYTVWLADAAIPDATSSSLDGLVFRITLDGSGEPVVFDSMRPSGQNHHFVVTGRAAPRTETVAPALTPVSLGVAPNGYRVRISLNGQREMDSLDFVAQSRGNASYRIVPESQLRSLAVNGSRSDRRSLYAPNGLVTGTGHGRGAGILSWSSGIRGLGSVRQWGHHATAMGDRRHFDDAWLIDKLFSIR